MLSVLTLKVNTRLEQKKRKVKQLRPSLQGWVPLSGDCLTFKLNELKKHTRLEFLSSFNFPGLGAS